MKAFRKSRCLVILLALILGCNRDYNSGDRVLVDKMAYDAGVGVPERFDVVVFKYPKEPTKKGVPTNYIKRLLGLPGEILVIFFGQLYSYLPGPGEPPPFDDVNDPAVNKYDLWKDDFMYADDPKMANLFREPGKFQILRKPPAVMLDMRRLVYDNDFQAEDLKGVLPPRWEAQGKDSTWSTKGTEFETSGANKNEEWLRYQHITRGLPGEVKAHEERKKELITDYMDYNAFLAPNFHRYNLNWVGDLMLEFELQVIKPEGDLWVELSRGPFRYQARFDLATGKCSLYRLKNGVAEIMTNSAGSPSTVDTDIKKPGTYQVRLANFDARLTLWVDREFPFGDGFAFDPPEIRAKGEDALTLTAKDLEDRHGPTENDLQPASIAIKGAQVRIRHLRLWRNTYYLLSGQEADAWDRSRNIFNFPDGFSWSDSTTWDCLRKLRFKTMYVQPDHFLCLGDNSPQSSDSREWGTVPRRLMLGRALLVYWPIGRAGPIR